MLATELAHAIERSFGLEISIADLLGTTPIAELAHRLSPRAVADHGASSPRPRSRSPSSPCPEFPLSRGQRALWLQDQVAPESGIIARAVRIHGQLDRHALQQALRKLAERHSALRTTITTRGAEPRQRVHEAAEMRLACTSAHDWAEQRLADELIERAEAPFDLERGPLLRAELFERSPTEHVLLLSVHHLIVDLWSLTLLVDELTLLYSAEEAGREPTLQPLSASFSHHVRREARMLEGAEGQRLRGYWTHELRGEWPSLRLPANRRSQQATSSRSAMHRFRIGARLTEKLNGFSRDQGGTLYTTLLTSLLAVLHRHTEQADLRVGTMAAGRRPSRLFAAGRLSGQSARPACGSRGRPAPGGAPPASAAQRALCPAAPGVSLRRAG